MAISPEQIKDVLPQGVLNTEVKQKERIGGGALLKVSGHRPVIMADLFKMALVWFMQYRSNAQDKMEDMFQ